MLKMLQKKSLAKKKTGSLTTIFIHYLLASLNSTET